MKKLPVKKTPVKRKYVKKIKEFTLPATMGGCEVPIGKDTFAPDPLSASAILTNAAQIVAGDRNSTHGNKERSFQVIADMWNLYLGSRTTGGDITPVHVAQMMELLKIARSIVGLPTQDHFTDSAGYAAIAGELSQAK
jgi:hypothetical protein